MADSTETFINASSPAEGVRVLAFNRPSKRNALSHELIRQLLEHLDQASKDDNVRVVVVTGSNTFFCGTSPDNISHPHVAFELTRRNH